MKIDEQLKKANDLLQRRNLNGALELLNKTAKKFPREPGVHFMKSMAYGMSGRFPDAITACEKVLSLAPGHPGALGNMANSYAAMGQWSNAIESYDKALKQDPKNAAILDNYGRALTLMGRRAEAVKLFERAVLQSPDYEWAHASLADHYRENAQLHEALEAYQRALALKPNLINAHIGASKLYLSGNAIEPALNHLKLAVALEPRNIEAYIGLSSAYRINNDLDESIAVLEKAEAIARDEPNLQAFKAEVLERQGKDEQAFHLVQGLLDKGVVSPKIAEVLTGICKKFGVCDQTLALIDQILATPGLPLDDAASMCFSAGSILDKLNQYDRAFDYYQRGNATHKLPPFDKDKERRVTENIVDTLSPTYWRAVPTASESSRRPVFVIGMPRSGTTLTERILAAHPEVYGAGELREVRKIALDQLRGRDEGEFYPVCFPELATDTLDKQARRYLDELNKLNSTASRVVDKMPHNFLLLGFIAKMFPEAKIIHAQRNPIDNCLSIYFQQFNLSHDYAGDLAHIAFAYKEYEKVMAVWNSLFGDRIYTLKYEELVADQEQKSRELIDFIGLDWTDECLNFHRSRGQVATASWNQVNRKMYTSSMARWKNYAQHIKPLTDAFPDYANL